MHHSTSEERFHLKAALYEVIAHQRQTLEDAIRTLPESQLKATSVEQLVTSFAEEYSINIPILDEAGISPGRREVDIDMTCDPTRSFMGGPSVVKGTEITISVPFSGDAEIFRFHPGNHVMDYPMGHIGDHRITYSQQGINLDGAQVRREFDKWLTTIKGHLDGMRKELGDFNDAIKIEIEKAINARLDKIKRDDDLLGGLGFGPQKETT